MVIAGIVLAGQSTGHDRWGLLQVHQVGAVGAGSPMIREFQPKQTGHCTGGRTMEQRWSLRKPVTFEVKVVYKCHPVVLGRSRNISLEGLFIDTGIMILPVGSCIEVEFGLVAGTQWEEVHMPAVVVHRNRDGCGIAFQTFNGKVFRVIEQLLYTHDHRVARWPQCTHPDGIRHMARVAV
jgi:hypothetical protein